MRVSVVVNVHGGTHFSQFQDAADSILAQEWDNMEFVVVVSDAPELLEKIKEEYGERPAIQIVVLEEDEGLSAARNAGVRAARGDIVAFTDDDVVAQPGWIDELMAIYEEYDPVGVGGRVLPIWPSKKPRYLPSEFYWLVGVTHSNFVREDHPQPVRNTFGCNISFKREAFLNAGGFREDLGKNEKNPVQGEEAELCERIDGEFWYTPDAIIHHKVDQRQVSPAYLINRSFWQGYSKAALPRGISNESSFLLELAKDSIPQRLSPMTSQNIIEIGALLTYTVVVGVGFAYGLLWQHDL